MHAEPAHKRQCQQRGASASGVRGTMRKEVDVLRNIAPRDAALFLLWFCVVFMGAFVIGTAIAGG